MFANSEDGPRFRLEEPTAPLPAGAAANRLNLLLTICAILLLTTGALRLWTAIESATDRPVKPSRPSSEPTARPSPTEKGNWFTLPPPPRI